MCRELTKKFEEVRRGAVTSVIAHYEATPPRGEVVLLVDRDRREATIDDMDTALRAALVDLSVKDAAKVVADELGMARRDVYQAALALAKTK